MLLILVRHAEAERQTQDDAARSLTERGQRQADWTAEQILARYQPDCLVVSPLKRAQQTMQAFSSRLPDLPVKVINSLKPDGYPLDALAALADINAECILVVSHMPVIAGIAALVEGEDDEDDPEAFELAEARVFQQPYIVPLMPDWSEELWRCEPPFFSASSGSE